MLTSKVNLLLVVAAIAGYCVQAEPCMHKLAKYTQCGDKIYQYIDSAVAYSNAAGQCLAMGARLAEPKSAEENKCVNQIRQGQTVWLGFTDNAKHQQFVDSKGTPICYKNWSRNEPNDWPNKSKNNEENCASMWHVNKSNGEWNDYACSRKYRFVCQFN